MRVIAGRHKRRVLLAPEGRDVRPTADRVRQALFDMIEHGGHGPSGESPLPDARVLDAFAGTGAMGIEALSRGAAHATFIESDTRAAIVCRRNLQALGEAHTATVLQTDALSPPRPPFPCDVAFLDPPYGSGLGPPALVALAEAGWFADGSLVTLETGAREAFDPPPGFTVLDERRHGAARVTILRYDGEDGV